MKERGVKLTYRFTHPGFIGSQSSGALCERKHLDLCPKFNFPACSQIQTEPCMNSTAELLEQPAVQQVEGKIPIPRKITKRSDNYTMTTGAPPCLTDTKPDLTDSSVQQVSPEDQTAALSTKY